MPYPVWKCLTYGIAQSLHYVKVYRCVWAGCVFQVVETKGLVIDSVNLTGNVRPKFTNFTSCGENRFAVLSSLECYLYKLPLINALKFLFKKTKHRKWTKLLYDQIRKEQYSNPECYNMSVIWSLNWLSNILSKCSARS